MARSAAGGGVAGVLLALAVATGGRLGLGAVAVLALLVSHVLFGAVLGSWPALVAGWVPPVARRGWAWSVLAGAGAVVGWALAPWWVAHATFLGWPEGLFALAGSAAGGVAGAVLGLWAYAPPVVVEPGRPRAMDLAPHRPLAVVSTIGLVGLFGVMASRPTPPAPRSASLEQPNVLLVTWSGARADRFGSYPIDTSAFDRVASEGSRIHGAVAASTDPVDSHVALLGANRPDRNLAERLRSEGYFTAGFPSAEELSRGVVGGGERPLDAGFVVYDDDLNWVKGMQAAPLGVLLRAVGLRGAHERRASDTIDRAIRTIEGSAGAWFVWVELHDPLAPFEPPPPWDARYATSSGQTDPSGATEQVARYDGEVGFSDAELARLLTAIDDRGLNANTLVVVVGAQGQPLPSDPVQGARGMSGVTAVDVPLAVRLPGRVPMGEVVFSPVSALDVAATVLDVALPADAVQRDESVAGEDAQGRFGMSLRPLLQGQGAPRAGVVTALADGVGWRARDAWIVRADDGEVQATLVPLAPEVSRSSSLSWGTPRVREVMQRLAQAAGADAPVADAQVQQVALTLQPAAPNPLEGGLAP